MWPMLRFRCPIRLILTRKRGMRRYLLIWTRPTWKRSWGSWESPARLIPMLRWRLFKQNSLRGRMPRRLGNKHLLQSSSNNNQTPKPPHNGNCNRSTTSTCTCTWSVPSTLRKPSMTWKSCWGTNKKALWGMKTPAASSCHSFRRTRKWSPPKFSSTKVCVKVHKWFRT